VKRPFVFAAGAAVLACAWLLPLGDFIPGPFSAHMTMHMAVVALGAPLVALGLAGGALDPVRRMPALLPAVPLSIVELVVVWAWHAPALHHAARHETVYFVLEQGSFFASALLVWFAAFGGDARLRGARAASGLVALLLTSMHMTLLGALLALPMRTLYAHHHAAPGSLDPLADQHLGGAIMLVAGGVAYLAGGLALAAELLRSPGGVAAATRSGPADAAGSGGGG
jgi:putative membrane protein